MDSPKNPTLFVSPQGHVVRHPRGQPISKKKGTNQKTGCCNWLLPFLGVICMILAVCVIIYQPLDRAVDVVTRFGPGSFVYGLWSKPPHKVSLRFYVFNYTNTEAFLRGEEDLRIQELGPYSYLEVGDMGNVTFNDNGTMTYSPSHVAVEDPEMTSGNPLEDVITVPNFAFLGLASYLADSSFFSNMAFNVFTRMVESRPFLTMTVDEYLRGYDEPLLKYANKIVPGMVSFDKLGYLDRIVNEGVNVVTISTNSERVVTGDRHVVEPYTVDEFNGSPGLAHWGYVEGDNATHEPCNTLRGRVTEGMFIPRKLTEDASFQLYRKSFCRTLPIVFDKEGVTTKGVPAYWMKMSEGAFNNSNPDNACYCDEDEGACLPDGLSDIGPCLFGLPLAMSFPHFLFGDPSLAGAWEGLNPNEEDHGTIGLVDNNFGVVLHARIRVQLNLIMKQTRYNALVQPFNGMVLPSIWVEYAFEDIPELYHNLLYVGVFVLPVLHYLLIAVLVTSGVAIALRVATPKSKTMYRRLSLHRYSTRNYALGEKAVIDA